MRKALLGVDAHAAPIGHDLPGIGGNLGRGLPAHHDVRSRAVAVLAMSHAADLGVVLRRPVGAVDGNRGREVAPDALQHHHQPGGHQNGIRAVLASKFRHLEVAGKLLCAVLRLAVCVDFYHRFSSFNFSVVEIHQNVMLHPPGAGDPLALEVTLAASAAVQHDGAFPASRRQIVTKSLRRPGGSGAVPGAVEGKPVTLDADGAPTPLSSLARVIGRLAQSLATYDQRSAGDVIPCAVWQHIHADVRTGVPGVASHGVGGCRQHISVRLEMAVDGQCAHIVEGAVKSIVRPGLAHDLGQRLPPGVYIDLDSGDFGKRHGDGTGITH